MENHNTQWQSKNEDEISYYNITKKINYIENQFDFSRKHKLSKDQEVLDFENASKDQNQKSLFNKFEESQNNFANWTDKKKKNIDIDYKSSNQKNFYNRHQEQNYNHNFYYKKVYQYDKNMNNNQNRYRKNNQPYLETNEIYSHVPEYVLKNINFNEEMKEENNFVSENSDVADDQHLNINLNEKIINDFANVFKFPGELISPKMKDFKYKNQSNTQNYNKPRNYKYNQNNFNNHKTHFINIPIIDDLFIEEYKKFTEFIKKQNLKDFYPDLLQKPGKLHFTVCVLSLGEDEEKIEKVNTILNRLCPQIQQISLGNLKCNFDGFSSMGKVNDCRVIYSKVKEDENYNRLCEIISIIIKNLVQEGIISKKDLSASHVEFDKKKDFYSIKIHMTLLNTLFLNKIAKKLQMKQIYSIDSNEILNFMNNKVIFPSVSLSEIHYSRMRENKITEKYEMLYTYKI